jgi:HJR/Mrr/RecB family endonuclease
MSGIDFELFISKQLKYLWYETIHTPKTGDQWADLIIKKENKTYIIQAKRYEGSVGNKAVQEVVGAVNFYWWDQWYVITNSLFTQSAKALAQKNKIILIDGHDLKNIENFF